MEFPVFQFLHTTPCSIATHHPKGPCHMDLNSTLEHTLYIYINHDEIISQPSFLQTEQSQPFQLFFVQEMPHALTFVSSCWSLSGRSLLTEKPRTGHSISYVTSQGQSRGEGSPPSTCLPRCSWCTLIYHWPLCHKGTLPAHGQLLSTRIPKSSSELLPSRSSPNLMHTVINLSE